MIYEVTHTTSYAYAQDAAFSQHLLRLTPRATESQRVLESRIEIDPQPDGMAPEDDVFGNTAHVATVSRPHRKLSITAQSRVACQEVSRYIFEAGAPITDVRAMALGLGRRPVSGISPFAFPSAMTMADDAIETYARGMLDDTRPFLAAAAALNTRIYEDFTYVPGATAADTLPAESFAGKRGVCQDFAHVMLACLRALRLPARYVSGYLRTIPPEGQERLEGADASHAWVAVWDPVFGWVDFDPTNNMVPGLDHITLSWGRDYLDVSPVSGLVVGAGGQSLGVGVDVKPVSDDAS